MKDGDNSDLAAQIKAAQEELKTKETELAEYKEKLSKTEGIAANAEKKLNEMGNEIGELRKAKKALEESQSAAGGRQEPPDAGKKTAEEQVAELEKGLTKEEEQSLDEAWQHADDSLKAKISSDPKTKLMFLQQVKSAAAPVSWRNKPVKAPDKGEDLLKKVSELFDRGKSRRRGPDVQSRGGLKPGGDPEGVKPPEMGPVGRSIFRHMAP